MIYISLKFILGLILMAVAIFLPVWLNRRLSKKDKYHVTYEYMPFYLKKDHDGEVKPSSWDELKQLGAEGWDITFDVQETYKSYLFILKRETLHQS